MDTFAHVALGMLVCSRSGLPALQHEYSSENIGMKDWTLWTAGAFAAMPDLSSFGLMLAEKFLKGELTFGKPPHAIIPHYVYFNYDLTHSLIIATLVGLLLWRLFPSLLLPFLAWPLHILCDIPLHGRDYFPTPLFWPFSHFTIDGYSFGQHRWIILCYWIVIVMLLTWRLLAMRKSHEPSTVSESE